MDFDAKHHGPTTVDADVDRALAWITECGGRAITDHSTSSGRHILIPLPLGIALTRAQVVPIVRLLAERLVTLDITPMCNENSGCITPPGSACKEGGFRTLDGTLDAAVDALTVRSDPNFLGRLTLLLGSARIERARTAARDTARTVLTQRAARTSTSNAPAPLDTDIWEGSGDHARLRAEYRRRGPLPQATIAFARAGDAPGDARWRARDGRLDRSAARQSVLAAALLRGYSLTDIHARLPEAGGDWAGLAAAYHRYGHRAHDALHRDWASACRWAARNAPEFLPTVHKKKEHTGGWQGHNAFHAETQTRWLATTTAWIDAHWPQSPRRWTMHAICQAIAYASVVGGHVVGSVPVVELGGRSLSIMAGCMPETTVWEALRELRDLPGSPLLRTRRAAGVLADQYALVTPYLGDRPLEPDPVLLNRTRVEPIHESWTVLGLHCRRIYELITHHGATTPADAIAGARMGRTAGYTALATLTTIGLITHEHGSIRTGPTSLDTIATAHGLANRRAERITQHRQHRNDWHRWLDRRFGANDNPVNDQYSLRRSPGDQLKQPTTPKRSQTTTKLRPPNDRHTQPFRPIPVHREDHTIAAIDERYKSDPPLDRG
ncbi:hypothetical protein [Nocardia sp. CA-119907]|uniref:hypothetical protein n=1 Tax=Nocardia sp. CA-119907 TaxID=3239973 RepID=UPI003D96B1F3